MLQGFTVSGESASVTAGALGSAAPGYRGATMAMHSTLGFTGSFFGPLIFGLVLDLAGGESVMAWGLAFAHMGVVMLAGPLALALLRPPGAARRTGRRLPKGRLIGLKAKGGAGDHGKSAQAQDDQAPQPAGPGDAQTGLPD